MNPARKPLLCLDVDGVVHGYQSGWLGADRMPDPPVPGAMEAIRTYLGTFRVALYSSRTGQPNGLYAMQAWLLRHLIEAFGEEDGRAVAAQVEWPHSKPPATVTLDDRAITFDGTWPPPEVLASFQPWNKRAPEHAPGLDPIYDAVARAVDASDLDGEHPDHEDWCASVDRFRETLGRSGYRLTRA